jgi:hypothetical protein
VAAALKRIRAEGGLPSPRAEGKGWELVMPQGSSKNRGRGNKSNPRNPGDRSVITLKPRGNKPVE